MNRKPLKNYAFLAIFIIALTNLPTSFSDSLRGQTIALLAHSWGFLASLKVGLRSERIEDEILSTKDEEIKRLRLENQLLNNEIVRFKELLEQELNLFSQQITDQALANEETKQALTSHQTKILKLFNLRLKALPARVIYRSANSWNSSFWLNVGEADNAAFGETIVAKNSPVVLGESVVGVIDYVGQKQSLVRLITDSGLNPSVRVSRAGILLAKGNLSGQSLPLWRSRSETLLGIGFNYDFSDAEGPARDLRTGVPVSSKASAIPILLHDDLLVTTGMDGVFPPGLKVGVVKTIKPLKEGDYYYELEAEPSVGNFDELSLVFVLPPVGYDSKVKEEAR